MGVETHKSESAENNIDSKLYRPLNLHINNEPRVIASEHSNQPSIIDKAEKTKVLTKSTRTRRPDRAVYVPRARRSQTTPRSSSTNLNKNNCENTNNSTSKRRSDPEEYKTIDNRLKCTENETVTNNIKVPKQVKLSDSNINKEESILVSECATNNLKNLSFFKQKTIDNSDCDLIFKNNCDTQIEEMAPPKKHNHHSKCVNIDSAVNGAKYRKDDDEINREENELRKVSQEINRTSRRIIKQTFKSDILEIGNDTVECLKSKEPVSGHSNTTPIDTQKPTEKKTLDPEEDDWENMFNESGDCLDPKMMDELTAQVGKVTIEKPKTDYKLYQTKQALLLEEEYPHVLEVSSFPPEFKTQDLIMTFSTYKESGFDIKWVDDTHALVVFSNSKIAAEVLSMNHAFVKVKPLKEATAESRNKAKKCSTSLQPYRQRPETCAALARRLVTGALGVRLKTAREERENERRILNEAREKKLLAAKQSDEIWDS